MIIVFIMTGFTLYKFDHPSLLLIRPDSYQQTFTIRISTIISLLFYCISLICYTVASYDWVINNDNNSIYYDSRVAMFICYIIAYLSMFIVLIERLKQMTIYIHKPYKTYIYIILIILFLSGIISFSIFFGIYHNIDKNQNESTNDNNNNNKDFSSHSNRGVALFFAFLGFFIFLSLSLMIIYLFFNKMYQHICIQQENLILSSSTDNYRDHHQHQIMLNMIKRYTSLSILSIFTTFIIMIPPLIYFSNYKKFHKSLFFENISWWILGADQIINVICIMLYLPLSIRLYHRFCCGMDAICDKFIINSMKQYIITKINNQRSDSELKGTM